MTTRLDSPLHSPALRALLGAILLVCGLVFVVWTDDHEFGVLLLLAGASSIAWASSDRFARNAPARRLLRAAGVILSTATIVAGVLIVF
ncbi:hypothetical protein [Aeromicrobium sp. UC242_57]|uniref:hypothetical protein n=1 Tax=Aeromicrobium sp. UC242_57 TaxID=3374624 RepID=UPI0037898A1F